MELGEYEYECRFGDVDWWQVGMRACTLAVVPRDLVRGSALDAGSGCGYFVRDLRGRGIDARGVDMSAIAVEFAHSIGLGDVVEQARLEAALAVERDLALVSMLDVLPHREANEESTVALAWTALAPGGRLVVRVPAYPWLYGAHDRFVHQTRRYTVADVRTLGQAVGFRVERTTFANCLAFPLVLAGRSAEWLRDRASGDRTPRSSNRVLPRPLNEMLRRGLLAEAAWIARGGTLPWGSSLLAVLRKPG